MGYLIPLCLLSATVLLNFPLQSVAAKDTCRNLDFYKIEMGKRLTSHIIKNVSVEMVEACSIECFMKQTCVSYNIGPQVNDKQLCELSDSDHILHPNDMVQKDGYSYRASRNACASSPCPQYARCLSGFVDDGYVCVCPPGYKGNHCQHDIDECTEMSHNCSQHAKCINTVGSFTCKCSSRYYGDGVNCTIYSYGSQLNAGKSCKDIKNRTSTARDAEYWIDPLSSGNPFKVFCDMTTDGGGWTLIKRTLLSSNGWAELQLEGLIIQDYREISNYTINHQLVPSDVLARLREDMGFDQLRFYCFKKAVGRVFHIKTALNDSGEAVVHSYTLTEAVDELDFQPKACLSFETFSDDTSILSRNCKRWGRISHNKFEKNRWGSFYANGKKRMYNTLVQVETSTSVRMISRGSSISYSCDDHWDQDNAAALSSGDTWKVFVR